jgi:prophage tail gpP-like protein
VTSLQQGENIQAAQAHINVAHRFSQYVVKGQAGIGYGSITNWGGFAGIAAAGSVQTQMRASATDPGVPRYRLHVTFGESQMTLLQMQQRANWQAQYGYGQSVKATITVPGFRQSNGALWMPNQIVSCTVPWLEIDDDLLIVKVKYGLDDKSNGHVTHLDVGPIQGYTPDPGQVKIRKSKKGKSGGINWSGFGSS